MKSDSKIKSVITKTIALLTILVALVFNINFVSAATIVPAVPNTVDLLAGQSIKAGEVTVWNDTTDLYVKYATNDTWVLNEVHLDVETSLGAIPQTSGKKPVAIPGQFAYAITFSPQVTSYTFKIPLSKIGVGYNDTIYVAAHAVVSRVFADGTFQTETGWGAGIKFGGAWGMYYNYTIKEPITLNEYVSYTDAGSAWGNGIDFGKNIADYFVFDDFSQDKTVVLGLGRNEINIGSVVAHLNAADKTIDVTFRTIDPYFMNQVHAYVGGVAPTNTAPGSYDNQYTVVNTNDYFQNYTFTLNLLAIDADGNGVSDFDQNGDGIVDGNPIYIAAHAHILTGNN